MRKTQLIPCDLEPSRNALPDGVDLSKATESITWCDHQRGIAIELHRVDQPSWAGWAVVDDGRRVGYRTAEEVCAYITGRHGDTGQLLVCYRLPPMNLQFFAEDPGECPKLNDEHTPFVIERAEVGWILHQIPRRDERAEEDRRGRRRFATFEELQAYADGRWGCYLGSEAAYA